MGRCSACDASVEGGELLCSSCLGTSGVRDAENRILVVIEAKRRIAAYRALAKTALSRAREYLAEGGRTDPRILPCLAEVRACRAAIAQARALVPLRAAVGPGLSKARVRARAKIRTAR